MARHPCAMSTKNFCVSNFIVTKVGEEWFEGRVVEINKAGRDPRTNAEERFYHVHLFRLYSEIAQPIREYFLFSATPENIKKFKVAPLSRVTQRPHLPKELRRIMDMDREDVQRGVFSALPSKQPVSKILNDFKKYMQLNKPGIFEEELEEIVLGFFHVFESIFSSFLLYKRERSYVDTLLSDTKNQQKSDIFGLEYLLRAIYLIQTAFVDKLENPEIRDMVFDFSVYLLDFLGINVDRYCSSRR